MYSVVPFEAQPNHKFSAKIYVDEQNLLLRFRLTYNEVAGYWLVDIYKGDSLVYSGLPLLPGLNLLEQVDYLGIGSLYLLKRHETDEEWPSLDTLESDWYIVWGDTGG